MKNYLTFIFLLCIGFSYAQTSSLKGRVLDSNGFPLPGATIQATPSNKAVVSDFNGFFTILDLDGNQTLKISYLGFKTIEASVVVSQDKTTVQNFTLSPEAGELEEVVISVFQDGIIKGLNKQKSDLNITNVVSADQIGKYPDDNVGDVLKRVAGISMQGDQGEARNIVMRGLGPGLNSITLNGERIPSAEGDNRNIQLDLIPSAMVQTIEVNKTLTPDMEADAIGGSVNLITRSNPSGFRANLTAAGGGQPIRDGGYNSNFAVVVADKLSDKFSYTFSGTIQTKDYGSDNIEFEWNDPDDYAEDGPINEMDIRRYDVKRTRRSVSLNLDYNLDENNLFYIKSIYNHRDDWENRYRMRVRSIDFEDGTATIRRQTKGGINNDDNEATRLEDQRTQKFTLGGEHQFGKLGLNWKVSSSKASEERPDERYVRYQSDEDIPFTSIDISNPEFPKFNWDGNLWNDPSNYEYRQTQEAFKFTEEKHTVVRLDLDFPYNTNDELKVGFKYNDKTKMRNDVWYEYDNALANLDGISNFDATISNYEAGANYQSGIFMTANALGNLNLGGINDDQFDSYVMDEFAAGNYDANEEITAFYAMVTDKLSENLTMIAGARIETTDISYTGYEFDEETMEVPDDLGVVNGSSNYTNILPNLTFQWDVNDKFNMNLAFTQSLARPAYFDLVPYEYSNSEDQELDLGNPDLDPAVSTNIDFMAEYYFDGFGLFSVGYFNKNIDDWIYQFTTNDFTYNGVSGYEMDQLRNGEKAVVNGFEITYQTRFLKNFLFMGNYTTTSSSTDRVEGRDDVPLVGQVDNMYNLSLAYENSKFFVRASFNHSDGSLDELSDNPFEDRYYDKQSFLDINANYRINDKWSLFAEGKNLTNQPLRYYQGVQSRTMQLEYYNVSWVAGLKYDF
ncbi:MAG: TonB-dependent receptor [Flavobacteriaceae bacterium]